MVFLSECLGVARSVRARPGRLNTIALRKKPRTAAHFTFQPLGGTREYLIFRNTPRDLRIKPQNLGYGLQCTSCCPPSLGIHPSLPTACTRTLAQCWGSARLRHLSLGTQRGALQTHRGIVLSWTQCQPKNPKAAAFLSHLPVSQEKDKQTGPPHSQQLLPLPRG